MKPEQLEALVAPIALYPDELLANVLAASTYPLEVVQADRWLKARKSAKRREEATSYMVEQLRKDAAERAALQAAAAHQLEATSPALAALEARDHDLTEEVREEIAALVERQPEDVAALLRGWLVERGA